jgi:heme oxygenase (biliverdin-IX-beta and delta-forming)
MSLVEAPGAVGSGSVLDTLRRATAAEHRRLEAEVHIQAAIQDPLRMRGLLGRFWGFHAAWQPAVERLVDDPEFMTPRRKLPRLETDLLNLGFSRHDIDALPLCPDAAPVGGYAEAMGSLYVLEGSTLGGQVISRKLREAGWPRGLAYFDPYGPQLGAFWRAFKGRAEAVGDAAAMARQAENTFVALRRWLTGVQPS